MGYVETLVEKALKGECPGCGPTLADLSLSYKVPSGLVYLHKYCTCCGWVAYAEYSRDNNLVLGNVSFSSMPPDVDGLDRFNCAISHPEHRANWPQPERDETQSDEFSWEELAQESLRLDGHHYNLISPEERCGVCREWAPHKISEERPNFYGHPYTSSLCCEHFEKIFGPKSHQYERVTTPVTLGDN